MNMNVDIEQIKRKVQINGKISQVLKLLEVSGNDALVGEIKTRLWHVFNDTMNATMEECENDR